MSTQPDFKGKKTPVNQENMVQIHGNSFLMGSDNYYPEEQPVHEVTVDGFRMDKFLVTNIEFGDFISATGYETIAERPLDPEAYPGVDPEDLVPGSLVFQKSSGPVDLRDFRNWWRWVPGANWKHPQGPNSSINGLEAHPVVHVAYEDAETYAEWTGKELPTEAEWEFAARGGLEGMDFTWGNEDPQLTNPKANTWQGEFPHESLVADGYEGTSPVGSFEPNGYGLYDMAGNVWEWTCDWFVPHLDENAQEFKIRCTPPVNPRVNSPEASYDPGQPQVKIPRKVMKGGSYLSAPNHSLKYRPAARRPQTIDTGMTHIGFRCIVREKKNSN